MVRFFYFVCLAIVVLLIVVNGYFLRKDADGAGDPFSSGGDSEDRDEKDSNGKTG